MMAFGSVILPLCWVLATVAAMEGLAWLVHRYLLHGPLWWLHRTHHEPQRTWYEANDLVGLFYAALSAGLIIWTDLRSHPALWVGIGIALYGVLYFLLHDVLVHQRLRWRVRPAWPYLQRLVRAHKLHHKHLHRQGAEAFGFLYAAPRYRLRAAKPR